MAYSTALLALSPVLYWRLGESSAATTAADASGSGNTGTYNDFAGTRTAITYGATGGLTSDSNTAVTWSENDGWVERANASALIAGQANVTLSLLLNIPSGTHDFKGIAGVRGWTGSAHRGFWLQRTTTNVIEAHYTDDDASPDYGTTFSLSTGAWHQVTVTYRSVDGEILVYVDGQPVALNTNTAGGVFNQTNLPFQVGRLNYQHNGAGSAWNLGGATSVDEVALFQKALNGKQVRDLYDEMRQTFRTQITHTYLLENRWFGVNTTGNAEDVGTSTNIDTFIANKSETPIHAYNIFCSWGDSPGGLFPAHECDNCYARNILPMISWEPQVSGAGVTQASYQLDDITAGNHDTYINTWLARAAAYGETILMRFAHEMNGANWAPWQQGYNGNGAGDYVAAWQYVYNKAVAAGATNLKWVWNPNVDNGNPSYPSTGWTAMADLYPGDAYVDWVGLDGFNRGTGLGDTWEDPAPLYQESYDRIIAIAPGKPILIGEVSSSETGGSKAAWITDLFTQTIPASMPLMRGVLWIDNILDIDWRVDSSGTSQDAFALAVAPGSAFYTVPRRDEFNGSVSDIWVETDTAGLLTPGVKRALFIQDPSQPDVLGNPGLYLDDVGRSGLGGFYALVRLTNHSNYGPLVSVSPSATDEVAAGSAGIAYDYPDFWAGAGGSFRKVEGSSELPRSIDYLFVVVPRAGGGYFVLVSGGSFGDFPTATLLEATDSGTDAIVRGHLAGRSSTFYADYGGIVTPESLPAGFGTRYGPALFADTFNRASLGTTTEFGGLTYTAIGSPAIDSSTRLDTTASYDGVFANPGVRARVVKARIVTTGGGRGMSVIIRGNGTLSSGIAFHASHLVTGLFDQATGSPLVQTGAWHLELNTTHEVAVYDYGDRIVALLDGQVSDYNTTLYNSQTQVGVFLETGTYCDEFSAWPEEKTLHADFGPFPDIPTGVGSPLYSTTFTGTNGTNLSGLDGWTATAGTWEINTNRARMTTAGVNGYLSRSSGAAGADVEVSADITMPATTAAYPTDWFCGLVVRYGSASNNIRARYLYQDNSPEIELWEIEDSVSTLINYVNLSADSLLPGSTHTMRLVAQGSEVAVYHDGELVIQAETAVLSNGTVGISVNDTNPFGQPSWDNFQVRSPTGASAITLDGTLSSAGDIRRSTTTRVTGILGLSPGGVLFKSLTRRFTATLASAGAVSTNLDPGGPFTVSRGGTLTTAGVIRRASARTVLGTLTTVGAIVRRVAKALAGLVSSVGQITQEPRRRLSGVPGLAGQASATKVQTITRGGTLTTAGGVVSVPFRDVPLAGALTTEGDLTISVFRAPIPDPHEAVLRPKVVPPEFNLREEEA